MHRSGTSLAFLLLFGCCLPSGCAVTRKSASIDSTSRMPWLGFELAPRQRQPAPEAKRIRLEGSIPLEPEPAKLMATGPRRKDASRRSLKRNAPEKPVSIAIPRTDVSETPPPAPDEKLSADTLTLLQF